MSLQKCFSHVSSLLCNRNSLMQLSILHLSLPPHLSTILSLFSLILPFLSCQIVVEAAGQCITSWRDSSIHRRARWEFTSHGTVFLSICSNVRSLHCSDGREGKIMASEYFSPFYYTLTLTLSGALDAFEVLVSSGRCDSRCFIKSRWSLSSLGDMSLILLLPYYSDGYIRAIGPSIHSSSIYPSICFSAPDFYNKGINKVFIDGPRGISF